VELAGEGVGPPVGFTLKHNRTVGYHKGKEAADVFYSFAPVLNGGFQAVYNIHRQNEEDTLETNLVGPSFDDQPGPKRPLPGFGEDPRAFTWNGTPYCLTWTPHQGAVDHGVMFHVHGKPQRVDWDHRMINLETGDEFDLNHCVSGFRGKNWHPLVYNGRLHIVHRLDPEVRWFRYDPQAGCAPPLQEPETTAITGLRGGSNFVPYGTSGVISIGHHTKSNNIHEPFLIHIDMSTNKSAIATLKNPEISWGAAKGIGILDPTSLWWCDGRLFMGSVKTAKRWAHIYTKSCAYCGFNASVYEIILDCL
jgi:hypothetical protein